MQPQNKVSLFHIWSLKWNHKHSSNTYLTCDLILAFDLMICFLNYQWLS